MTSSTKRAARAAAGLFGVLASGVVAQASQTPPGAVAAPFAVRGSLELDGDSTLHRFSARTTAVRAVVHLDEAAPPATETDVATLGTLLRGGHVRDLQLATPTEKLSSGDGALDRNMWKALKSDRYKEIRFQADRFELAPPVASGSQFRVAMHGSLSVAGVARPVVLTADAFGVPGGVRLAGSADLRMTDFAVKPPTLMFGAIKTADLVVIKFDMELRAPGR